MQNEQSTEQRNIAGFYSEIDYSKDFEWCQKAAGQGDAVAQRDLAGYYAGYYSEGNVVEIDLFKAFEWYQKAAEQGDFIAMERLADCYLNGKGVDKNLAKAIKLLELVASQYIPDNSDKDFIDFNFVNSCRLQKDSQYLLGNYYLENNPCQAIEWFQKASLRGHQEAKRRLAECYIRGIGVKKDLEQGFNLLEEVVVNLNHAPLDELELAIRYLFCKEIKQSLTIATNWFEKAANHPLLMPENRIYETQAKTMLGICYFHEYGIRDNDSAFNLFEDSALKCFECSSKERKDSLGHLWLACMYQKDNAARSYKPNDLPWWHKSHSEKIHISYAKNAIDALLFKSAAGFYLKDDGYDYKNPDIIDFLFPNDTIMVFLENQVVSYAKVILAFYYQCKNEIVI